MLKLLLALYTAVWALFALAILHPVSADVLHERGVGNVNTLICDKPSDVEAFIVLSETGESPTAIVQVVEGCGFITQPVLLRVETQSVYETSRAKYLLVKYTFHGIEGPPQYGIYTLMKKAAQLSL